MALTTDVRYIGPNNRHMAKVNIRGLCMSKLEKRFKKISKNVSESTFIFVI